MGEKVKFLTLNITVEEIDGGCHLDNELDYRGDLLKEGGIGEKSAMKCIELHRMLAATLKAILILVGDKVEITEGGGNAK